MRGRWPALGGLIIAASSVGVAYLIDAASCLAVVWTAFAIGPHRPALVERPPPIRRSIAAGLRFVRSNNALSGSFAIDLVAMTFGMPRALFAVLSLTVYHAGASGTGLLYAGLSGSSPAPRRRPPRSSAAASPAWPVSAR